MTTYDNAAAIGQHLAALARKEAAHRKTSGEPPLYLNHRWYDRAIIMEGATFCNLSVYTGGYIETLKATCPEMVEIPNTTRMKSSEGIGEYAVNGHIFCVHDTDDGSFVGFADERDAVFFALSTLGTS